VITEAAWLLRDDPRAVGALMGKCADGSLQIEHLGPDDVPRIREVLWRYRDLGAQLADASLLRLAEREHLDTVFTLDERDFRVYRLQDGRALKLLP
jgi:predicted nucleic acid-binding protein